MSNAPTRILFTTQRVRERATFLRYETSATRSMSTIIKDSARTRHSWNRWSAFVINIDEQTPLTRGRSLPKNFRTDDFYLGPRIDLFLVSSYRSVCLRVWVRNVSLRTWNLHRTRYNTVRKGTGQKQLWHWCIENSEIYKKLEMLFHARSIKKYWIKVYMKI